MDIREAVKDKANYADIVTYFQNLNMKIQKEKMGQTLISL